MGERDAKASESPSNSEVEVGVGVQDVAASVEGDVVEEEGAFISLGLVIDLAQTGKLNSPVHIPTPSRHQ